MGTAPRRPTQATMAFSRIVRRLEARVAKTATGQPTRRRKGDITMPLPATAGSREGKTSRPSVRNVAICINHAKPS